MTASLVLIGVGQLLVLGVETTSGPVRFLPGLLLAGVATGINQTTARVGGLLSVAAIGALAGAVFVAAGGTGDTPFDPRAAGQVRDAGLSAFHAVALSVAGLAFAASALAALLLRRSPTSSVARGDAPRAAGATAVGDAPRR